MDKNVMTNWVFYFQSLKQYYALGVFSAAARPSTKSSHMKRGGLLKLISKVRSFNYKTGTIVRRHVFVRIYSFELYANCATQKLGKVCI